ncbi:hypothetical protein ACFSKL_10035 [Belliella marina]|uniref:DUF4843 domain-containing protein n=1 Tax=Belliella marina TaxID=1644146 RepID=A0ABW4VK91_9BACT
MKKLIFIFSLVLLSGIFTGCFEDYDERFLFTDFRVEFQDAVVNNPGAGLDYAVVATLNDNAGLREYQVNLIGGLSDTEQIIPVVFLTDESTAVENTHFSFPNGAQVVIPAGEAFGKFSINIPVLENTSAVRAVFELQSNDMVKASANHKKIGFDIVK